MFQKVVKLADPNVTLHQLEIFFKHILNNSLKRAAEGETPRRRPHSRKRRKIQKLVAARDEAHNEAANDEVVVCKR